MIKNKLTNLISFKRSSSQIPVSKGKIKNLQSQLKRQYIVFEGLASSSNYTLLIYSNTESNPKSFELILNQTLSTLKSNKQTSKLTDLDYVYDDDDEEDSLDYLDTNTQEDSAKRIIHCDLNTKETEFTSQTESLIAKISKSKRKSHIITINYSANSMNRLLDLISNKTYTNRANIIGSNSDENFLDFFKLNKFSQNSEDLSTNYDCLKQFKQTKSSKPLCLFNIESVSNEESLNNEDYDDYDADLNILSNTNEYFSVQTSIIGDDQSLVYVLSNCHKFKRANLRNPPNSRSISSANITTSTTTTSTTTSTKYTTENSELAENIKQLSSYKKSTSNHSKQIASINNCQIFNNKEIRFEIESAKLNDMIQISGKTSSAHINRVTYINQSLPYYFYIEILMPKEPGETPVTQSKARFLKTSYYSSINFKFKIENYTQV